MDCVYVVLVMNAKTTHEIAMTAEEYSDLKNVKHVGGELQLVA